MFYRAKHKRHRLDDMGVLGDIVRVIIAVFIGMLMTAVIVLVGILVMLNR